MDIPRNHGLGADTFYRCGVRVYFMPVAGQGREVMTPENAQADYLDGLDKLAANDCNGFPLSFDEWNATNARMGRPCGTWGEYLNYCRNYVPAREYATLVQFGAIDDDDYLGG